MVIQFLSAVVNNRSKDIIVKEKRKTLVAIEDDVDVSRVIILRQRGVASIGE